MDDSATGICTGSASIGAAFDLGASAGRVALSGVGQGALGQVAGLGIGVSLDGGAVSYAGSALMGNSIYAVGSCCPSAASIYAADSLWSDSAVSGLGVLSGRAALDQAFDLGGASLGVGSVLVGLLSGSEQLLGLRLGRLDAAAWMGLARPVFGLVGQLVALDARDGALASLQPVVLSGLIGLELGGSVLSVSGVALELGAILTGGAAFCSGAGFGALEAILVDRVAFLGAFASRAAHSDGGSSALLLLAGPLQPLCQEVRGLGAKICAAALVIGLVSLARLVTGRPALISRAVSGQPADQIWVPGGAIQLEAFLSTALFVSLADFDGSGSIGGAVLFGAMALFLTGLGSIQMLQLGVIQPGPLTQLGEIQAEQQRVLGWAAAFVVFLALCLQLGVSWLKSAGSGGPALFVSHRVLVLEWLHLVALGPVVILAAAFFFAGQMEQQALQLGVIQLGEIHAADFLALVLSVTIRADFACLVVLPELGAFHPASGVLQGIALFTGLVLFASLGQIGSMAGQAASYWAMAELAAFFLALADFLAGRLLRGPAVGVRSSSSGSWPSGSKR